MAELLPRLAAPKIPFDPRALAQGCRNAWLEIGFGAGEHLAHLAATNPEILILGAEIYRPGVASALSHIAEKRLANVRLQVGDVRDLTPLLPEASIGRIYLLFPDPWPKARHRKRRLVQPRFVSEAARIIADGGELVFTSDWSDYIETCLIAFVASSDWAWTAEQASDWRSPPAGHSSTRYQAKALGDCAPVWLIFRRCARSPRPRDPVSSR
ncbi:MAG: tRNA (guanosine(46)-N7)-methyltransferase TrmB [Caulobacteraceae bacterium]